MKDLSTVMFSAYNFLSSFKNLYGKFGISQNGHHEYYLKLDGYYYCPKNKGLIGVIRVRNKRIKDLVVISKIIHDKEYLKELHPTDACIIGLLANSESNDRIDLECSGWRRMRRLKEVSCFIKAPAILKVSRTFVNAENAEIIVLGSDFFGKEIEISAIDLCKNQALLYALGGLQAISIGYQASELIIRKELIND